MKKQASRQFRRAVTAIIALAMVFDLAGLAVAADVALPKAAPLGTNLIKGGSFESDIYTYWGVWKNNSRVYTYFRSYDAAFGQGSYSIGVEASGEPSQRIDAGLVGSSNNSFLLEPNKKYLFKFYAKSDSDSKVSVYLEDASSYQVLTPLMEQNIGNNWKEYEMIFSPAISAPRAALVMIAFGDLADKNTVYLDSLTMLEFNPILVTKEVKGLIGEERKSLRFNNLTYIDESEIQVELPYYDNLSGKASSKKFAPTSIQGSEIFIKMHPQTFSGIGKVYIRSIQVGQFDYNVTPKIQEFYPTLLRADQDVTLKVTGYNPNPDSAFVVVKKTDGKGKIFDNWIKPHTFDSQLSYVTFKLPVGVVSGPMFMQTSFQNTAGKSIETRTSAVAYKVKPVIFSTEWSTRGFDQVGDKLKIHGKGIAKSPIVVFYNSQGKMIMTRAAKLVSLDETEEVIEVEVLKNVTSAEVRVRVDGIESDNTKLVYLAKPKLNSIVTQNKRAMRGSGEVIPAAKISEEIVLNGEGFLPNGSSTVEVEFQAFGKRVSVPVEAGKISQAGNSVRVVVPQEAQSGMVAVKSNGQTSNYRPLEIIPKIISITPNPMVPGESLALTTRGVGNVEELTKVIFTLTATEKVEVSPDSMVVTEKGTVINVKAPLAISNNATKINVRYDRWQDDGKAYLNVNPTITNASIDLDDGVLTIKGYGFSVNPKENLITYKYADQERTVIQPRVQMLGVFPTEEGQEIRIKMLDSYHFGYVSVKVGNNVSNEANFGPVSIRKIVRRVEIDKNDGVVKGFLYISGYNFGSNGDVKVGSQWATTHYRTDFFIIAVVDKERVYDNPVIVTKN